MSETEPIEIEDKKDFGRMILDLRNNIFSKYNNFLPAVESGGIQISIASMAQSGKFENLSLEKLREELPQFQTSFPEAVQKSQDTIRAMATAGISDSEIVEAKELFQKATYQSQAITEQDVSWYKNFLEKVAKAYELLINMGYSSEELNK